MTWIEPEDDVDEEFVEFINSYNSESKPDVMEMLDRYADKEIIIFKSRDEADNFLRELEEKYESY